MNPSFQIISGVTDADGRLTEWGDRGDFNRWMGIGYDAIQSKGQRRQPGARVLSEDLELRDLGRRQLSTSLRDIDRNYSVVQWMVNRHLDYITSFHFRARTSDTGLNREIENYIDWFSRPENCDLAARHSWRELWRLWELRAVIDGDVLVNRLQVGKFQTVEGDRIQTFGGIPFAELGIDDPARRVVNGIYLGKGGQALGYLVFKRPPNYVGLVFDRMLSARFADLHGYFRRYDQVRGISPMASAHNTLRDTYEASGYALGKMKVAQIAAMAILRQSAEGIGEEVPGIREDGAGELDARGDKPKYDVRFNRGPQLIELDRGDDLKIIESHTPSTEFQQFSKVSIMIALRALDIPFTFFDENHANYSGSRLAALQYEDSAKSKRYRLRRLLDKQTGWRLGIAIADDELSIPPKMVEKIKWEWVHDGLPLFDPVKEITGSIAAISAGLSSPQREGKMMGVDVFQMLDEKAQFEAYAKKKGLLLSTALASTQMDDPNKQTTKTEVENEEEDDDDDNKPRTSIWEAPAPMGSRGQQ